MKRNARLLTRPRMSQTHAPFPPGTDEYRRWQNVLHINGELCDILCHIDDEEKNDTSLRGKLDNVKREIRSLRDSLDYYDGQWHTEFGHPMFIAHTPSFYVDEYSGISSSSEDEKIIERAFYPKDGERIFGPSKSSTPTYLPGRDAGQSRWLATAAPPGTEPAYPKMIEFNPLDSEEEEQPNK